MKKLSIIIGIVFTGSIIGSCSKDKDQISLNEPKSTGGSGYSDVTVHQPIKHSPTFGDCKSVGGWCPNLDIDMDVNQGIGASHAEAIYSVDGSMLRVTFVEYGQSSLVGKEDYVVDTTQILPSSLVEEIGLDQSVKFDAGSYALYEDQNDDLYFESQL